MLSLGKYTAIMCLVIYILCTKNVDIKLSTHRSRFWFSCLGPLVVLLRTLLNYSAFKSFDFEGTWWRFFQKKCIVQRTTIKTEMEFTGYSNDMQLSQTCLKGHLYISIHCLWRTMHSKYNFKLAFKMTYRFTRSSHRNIMATQRNLEMWSLWAVALYIQLKIIFTIHSSS
jgi:hypothetical protein